MTDHVESVQNNNIDLGTGRGRKVLAALVASGALLMTGCSASTEATKPSVVATAPAEVPATPSAEATPTTPETPPLSYEELVKSLEIPVTGENGERQSNEEIAQGVLRVLDEWALAGKSQQIVDIFYSNNSVEQSRQEILDIASEQSGAFTDALFTDGWESNPRLSAFTEQMEKFNRGQLISWAMSERKNRDYRMWHELISATPEREDKYGNVILIIELQYHYEEDSKPTDNEYNGATGKLRVNLHTEDGVFKMTDIGGEDTIKQI